MKLGDRAGNGNEHGADWGQTCGGFGVMETVVAGLWVHAGAKTQY